MVLIREGATSLYVPTFTDRRGPGKKSGEVFFNPAMAFNRDITVLAIGALRPKSFLDAMAATGAMGVRVGNESLPEGRLRLNDPYPKAMRYLMANKRINGLDAEISSLRISEIDEEFDHLDIDPFGSPAPYFASISLAKKSVSLTATDTPVLCGLYPKKLFLRYGARNTEKGPQRKELGLRILIARSVIEAKRAGLDLRPILSFYRDHYFRVFLAEGRGGKGSIKERAVWEGPLHDLKIVEKMIDLSGDLALADRRTVGFLKVCLDESKVGSTSFYHTDELASLFKRSPPKLDSILEGLKSSGFPSSRTHFDPKGIRTEASIEDIEEIFN
jgi:tRNA (guanine26-N2/guanine27-N2)-dimethyltransferase